MIKTILLGILLTFNLYANIEVSQNIRALYRGVDLTETQEDYILDNQDKNIELIKNQLQRSTKHIKYTKEKNVVSFVITSNGNLKNIKFLEKSDERKIDRATTKAIKKIYKYFKRPKEDTEIRFIISFYQKNIYRSSNKKYKNKEANEEYFIPIGTGTTRFEYSSKEYIRVFSTTKDGFINLSVRPGLCAGVTLLTSKNQKVNTGAATWYFNTSIPKGNYKLLIRTNKTCDINLNYI